MLFLFYIRVKKFNVFKISKLKLSAREIGDQIGDQITARLSGLGYQGYSL